MTYKTILALFQNEPDADILLDGVAALAAKQDARIFGFHPEIIPATFAMASGFPDVELVQDASKRATETTSALNARFDKRVGDLKLNGRWIDSNNLPGSFSAGVLPLARSCDLVVTTQPNPDAESVDIDTILYDSGRPVLVLPRQPLKNPGFKRIVVGWNGSREAARAAFDALPFLTKAKAVDLLVLDKEDESLASGQQGEAIAATLARHGVPVTRVAAESGKDTIEQAIVRHAVATDADLLVMGAYGHSWLREFLFGGVTRSVMESAPIPTLMSH